MKNIDYPQLSNSLLKLLRDSRELDVDLPDISTVAPKESILQIGFGCFLRGFIADFVQQAIKAGDFHGRIVAVQRTADDRVEHFRQQDGLYTLVLRRRVDGKLYERKRVLGSISRLLVAETEWEKVLTLASSRALKVIVSNATESGLALDPTDRLRSSPPRGLLGKLTQILYTRWELTAGHRADIAIIPCELTRNNGMLVRSLVLQQADEWQLDERFVRWVMASVHFTNTLVDRIIVGTPDGMQLESEWEALGYKDRLINCAEPFYLFALEADEFTRSNFPIDRASPGVQFVTDLEPFRIRKLRILNGCNSILAAIGLLLGMQRVREVVDDPDVGTFIEFVMSQELVLSVNLAYGIDNTKYAHEVLERLGNPFLRNDLAAICTNCSTKAAIRLFPILREHSANSTGLPGGIIVGLAAVLLVLRDSKVEDVHGPYIKEQWDCPSNPPMQSLRSISRNILAKQCEWSREAIDLDVVADAVAQALAAILTRGMRSVLKAECASRSRAASGSRAGGAKTWLPEGTA